MEDSKKRPLIVPTVQEVLADELTPLSIKYWAGPAEELAPFDPDLVDRIYKEEISSGLSRIMFLELSRYLELYLWPNFRPDCSDSFVKSIMCMVNEKFRENVPEPWACFEDRGDAFPSFFQRVLALKTNAGLTVKEDTAFVVFLINCYQSNGVDLVRKQCLRLTYLPLWLNVNITRVELELENAPESVRKRWAKLVKRNNRANKRSQSVKNDDLAKSFFPFVLKHFLDTVERISTGDDCRITYCERLVELLIDLMAQLTTRRFLHLLVSDMHIVVRSRLCWLYDAEEGSLFSELVDMLRFYETFEINNYTGSALSDEERSDAHCSRLGRLQKLAFRDFPDELRELALSNIGAIESADGLLAAIDALSDEQLVSLCSSLALTSKEPIDHPRRRELYLNIITSYYEKRHSQLDAINETGIYPTEDILWDKGL